MIPAQMQIPGLDLSANLHNSATEVLCLMNMLDIEELMDDEEYEGNKNVKRGRSLIKVMLIERQILVATIRGQRIIFSSRHKRGKKSSEHPRGIESQSFGFGAAMLCRCASES